MTLAAHPGPRAPIAAASRMPPTRAPDGGPDATGHATAHAGLDPRASSAVDPIPGRPHREATTNRHNCPFSKLLFASCRPDRSALPRHRFVHPPVRPPADGEIRATTQSSVSALNDRGEQKLAHRLGGFRYASDRTSGYGQRRRARGAASAQPRPTTAPLPWRRGRPHPAREWMNNLGAVT